MHQQNVTFSDLCFDESVRMTRNPQILRISTKKNNPVYAFYCLKIISPKWSPWHVITSFALKCPQGNQSGVERSRDLAGQVASPETWNDASGKHDSQTFHRFVAVLVLRHNLAETITHYRRRLHPRLTFPTLLDTLMTSDSMAQVVSSRPPTSEARLYCKPVNVGCMVHKVAVTRLFSCEYLGFVPSVSFYE